MACVEDELTDPTAVTLSVSCVAVGKAQEFDSAKDKGDNFECGILFWIRTADPYFPSETLPLHCF